ncbi:MAG: nucleoside monophosphate kinase [Verrucomicrobiaceae bacterium]|nr:nucleoside monophosphate kinase [Verrucomicrobiaceae bacterium]
MADENTSPRYRTILILGAPGSGKGTQGKVLGSVPRFHHLACGDVFRSLDTRTPLGQQFVSYASKGELMPDDLTVKLWRANVKDRVDSRLYKPDIDFLVLDGIPRNVEQAKLLEPDVEVLKLFHLSCPNREELARRLRKRALKDNRFDDASDKVIYERFAIYDAETKPILDYYAGDKVVNIDASQSPARVLHEILGNIMELDAWKAIEAMKV